MPPGSIKPQTFCYSQLSRLNTLEIYLLDRENKGPGYWIVYIHGGGWRDPKIDASSISATIPYLAPVSSIKGIASLNYRLSPYPTDDGNDPARNATHPEHIEDILTAICYLQHKYGFGEHYVLVGHSAGATLAFQSVSGIWKRRESTPAYPLADFVSPVAIAGVAGIYEIKTLIESFPTVPIYRDFIEAAFGKDKQAWKKASPANAELSWANARVAMIAASEDDELVDQAQDENMWTQLLKQKTQSRKDLRMNLHGDHDSLWIQGSELAKVINRVIDLLTEKSQS